eukprot:1319689-Rhodomonas_salina.2
MTLQRELPKPSSITARQLSAGLRLERRLRLGVGPRHGHADGWEELDRAARCRHALSSLGCLVSTRLADTTLVGSLNDHPGPGH